MVAARSLAFDVIGPVQVRLGGQPVEVGAPMVRLLLARLLVDANRVVSADRLVDDLWDGAPPPGAHGTLQSYVSLLRRTLEPGRLPRQQPSVLLRQAPGYVLRVDADQLDAARFAAGAEDGRRLLHDGRAAEAVDALDQALDLWRGEPYADVDLDAIVVAERRRLQELHATVREDRLAALLELGRHRYVLGELEALAAAAPYRERGWELLMLAQYRSGRQVEALRTYQEARRALGEHAGIEPGPRLVELERQIVGQDPSLDWHPQPGPAPAHALPSSSVANRTPVAAPHRSPLVGRDDALGTGAAVLQRLVAGVGGVLLITGEAGIGKTRLVEEVLAPARELGIRATWGRASDDEGAPGYWLWSQALRSLAQSIADDGVRRLDPHIAHVLPDLAERGLPPLDRATADPGAARFAVQRAVVELLVVACAQSPTVVVFDDVHWADHSSLRLLGALGVELTGLPLVVVATYRPLDAAANAALTDALAHLARHCEVTRVALRGLDRRAVSQHLAGAGVQATPRVVREVHERSGGNPFFLSELTRLIAAQQQGPPPADGGAVARVPHAVHDVTRQRLARLPADTVELLSLAAVAGRTSTLHLLADVAAADVEDLLDRLAPAIDAGLLVLDEERPGSIRFAHDLQREAIYEALPPTTRVRQHRRIARSLTATAGDDHSAAGQIAHHFAASMALGGADEVVRWASVAATHATQRGADDEAVGAWELALRAHHVAQPDDDAGRYDLLVAVARARRSAWDLAGAGRAIGDAVALAQQMADARRVLDAAALTGEVALWNWAPPGAVPHGLLAAMEEALAHPDPLPAVTKVRGLGALALALRYEDGGRSRALSDAAVAAAEELGDHGELVRALNNAYLVRWWRPHYDELLALADRILSLGGLRPEHEAVALMHRMVVLAATSELEGLAAGMERAVELRRLVRAPDVAAQLDLNVSMWRTLQGRADEARELLERAYRTRYQESTMWAGEWVYHLGRRAIGDLDEAEIDRAATKLASQARNEALDLIRPTAILALLDSGRRDEARDLVGAGPRVRECWNWQFNLVQWADIIVQLDLPGAAQVYAQLAPFADDLVVAGSNLACFGPLHAYLARLGDHLGDRRAAALHLRRSEDHEQRLRAWRVPELDPVR